MLNAMLLESNSGSWILLAVMAALIVALLVGNFFMQRKQKKQAQETMSKLKVGDVVVTIGGIKGSVVQVNESDDTVVIETGIGDTKTTVTFFKGAIQTVNPEQQAAAAPAASEIESAEEAQPAEEASEPAEELVEEPFESSDDEVKH